MELIYMQVGKAYDYEKATAKVKFRSTGGLVQEITFPPDMVGELAQAVAEITGKMIREVSARTAREKMMDPTLMIETDKG